MAEWVKLSTNIFANKKIRMLRSYPNGDSLALLWINLICCAGEINDNGMVYLTEGVPYTPDMLAAVGGYDIDAVNTALNVFQKLNMVEVDEEGYITILGWEEHQSVTGLERIREQNKLRKQKQRERDKNQNGTDKNCDSHEMSRDSHAEVPQENKNKSIDNYDDDDDNNPISNLNSRKNANSKAIKTKANNSSTVVVDSKANSDVFDLYSNNICPITPILAEKLQALIGECGEAAVKYGIEAAVEQGVRTYPYVLACAKNYLADGGKAGKQRPRGKPKVNDVEGTIAQISKEIDEGKDDWW